MTDLSSPTANPVAPHPEIHFVPSVAPLLGDYRERRESFSWQEARSLLAGLPGGGLNMAHEAVDRHADGELRDVVALRFLDRGVRTAELTYAELRRASDVVAVGLRSLGLTSGDRVCTLLPRSPELYLTVLGTLKAGGVYCPLFPAFGPEPVFERLSLGRVRVLVTDTLSY
jgi:acetyl-CoA synthetase